MRQECLVELDRNLLTPFFGLGAVFVIDTDKHTETRTHILSLSLTLALTHSSTLENRMQKVSGL